MKAISTITIMPFTIEQRADYVNQVVNDFNHLPEHEQAKIFIHLKAVVKATESELVDTATGEVIQPAIVTASEVLTVKMK
jgi:predicted metallopeptidase